MDQGSSLSWQGQLQGESLMPANDDEFTNLLDFGFQFPDLESRAPGDQFQPMTSSAAENGLVRMDTDAPYTRTADNFSMGAFANPPGHPSNQVHPTYSNADITPGYYAGQPSQHQHLQTQPFPQQQLQQTTHQQPSSQQYGHTVIPPTPNSIELQGSAARYPQRLDENHELYDRIARTNDEQVFYTPLISPAMTPLETQFRLPEYTIPGEYFTPLTSPAIEAQNSNPSNVPPPRSQPSDMGYIQSPVDRSVPASSAPSSPAVTRKHRRRPSATSKVAGRAKKQSPSVRPQTRKKSLLSLNSDEVLNGLSQNQTSIQTRANGNDSSRYGSNESNSMDSISPEPLSEPVMPPPALPPPRKSPAVGPQVSQGEAATPATLMRIQRSERGEGEPGQSPSQARPVAGGPHDDIMEDVTLPEAATPTAHLHRSKRGRIDNFSHPDTASPTIHANGTPSIEPKPAGSTAGSTAPSPRTIAMPSPSGPTGKKSDSSKGGASNKKRQSLSVAQPSPQLRPKISPNVQPLSRANDAAPNDNSAMYLASKSNYQHILDGTHLPGVTYPETLAENLTSKRTNHKLAEQGRRNRINNALKEIETLVPQDFANARNAKEAAERKADGIDKEKEKAASQAISKASAVEMAIDYIRSLQHELGETKGKLAVAETQLGHKIGQ